MKKQINTFLLLFLTFTFYSQKNYRDSLLQEIKNAKIDTNKVNNLILFCNYNLETGNFNSAIKAVESSLKIAKKLDFKMGIANSYIQFGNIYWTQGKYPESLKNYFLALNKMDELENKKGIASVYSKIGRVYYYQNNFKKAIEVNLKSLQIAKKIGDKQRVAGSYNNTGNIYTDLGKYKEALDMYLEFFKIMKELNDEYGLATAYTNIASIKIKEKKFNEALENYLEASRLYEKIGNLEGLTDSYSNLGIIYTSLKNYPKAKHYLNDCLKLSKKFGMRKISEAAYFSMANLDSVQGNWKSAYENYKNMMIYHDSIFNEESKEKSLQASITYEFEKKEALNKIAQQKKDFQISAELKKQQYIKYSVSLILVLVLIFLIFLINRYRLIRKQKEIIELKEKVTQAQKHDIEEKQKEILESITYAKRIQKAILPQPKLVKEFLEDSFILYKPKDIVAGDFYWLEVIGDLVLFASADCTGHGVPGAMVSVVCNNGLNRAVREFGLTNPNEILDKTRALVIEEFEKSDENVMDGMDISICALNTQSNVLKWAGANNPLWILRNEELIEYKADKQPIGKYSNAKPFTLVEVQLNKNDIIYIFTDGYQDQFGGPKEKKFRVAQMKELFLTLTEKSMEEQRMIIDETFENWKRELEQIDDVCIIGVRI